MTLSIDGIAVVVAGCAGFMPHKTAGYWRPGSDSTLDWIDSATDVDVRWQIGNRPLFTPEDERISGEAVRA